MTPPILVAVDPHRDDPAPLALGLRLARLAGAPLLLCATYPTHRVDRVHPELAETLRNGAEAALSRAAAEIVDAPGAHPPIELRAVATTGSPSRALHDLAEADEPLLLVLGSSVRGPLGRVSPGAVTDRLLRGAPCAVAVAPRGLSLAAVNEPWLRVGAAYIDAPDAQAALHAASAISRAASAYLRLLVVMPGPEPYVSLAPGAEPLLDDKARRADAQAQLDRGLEAAAHGMASGEVLDGDPPAVLAAASAELDLLVCGSRGYGPLKTLLLGGTSHALVRRAACPVLVVPRGTEERLVGAFGAWASERIGARS
jgi:nucleotide-binding universal stress UspA family protein